MKLAYQIATAEVIPAPRVTAYQGDMEEAMNFLAGIGYEGVELMVSDPEKSDGEMIKKLADRYGLKTPMVCTGEVFGQDGLFFSSPSPEVRKEALRRACRAVDLAKTLGAQVNVGRLRGGFVFGEDERECRKRSVEGLKALAEYAASKEVITALEPVNTLALNFINTTEEGIELVKEIGNPYMRLMLDSAHMYIEDKDIQKSIERARDYTTYVHLADSNRLYPGNSKVNFSEFIEALRDNGYDGWLSVEVFQRPDQKYAAERSFAFIKPMLE